MAGFPPQMPGPGIMGGQMPTASPPPSVPGVTQPTAPPPAALIQALARKPEQAGTLIKQAILLLEQAASMDSRQEPRLSAAVKLLRGPSKGDTQS